MRKIWRLFLRDLKVNFRDFIALYIIVFPLILAVGINLLSPSINDTTVSVAMISNENKEQIEYFEKVAKVELFEDKDSVIERVKKRDNIIGILPKENDYYILSQGNEPSTVIDYSKLLLTLYESGSKLEDTNAEIIDFNQTVPPLKKLLVNISILMISILGGMLIALNIIEEKTDRTIRAINVTPVSQKMYIIGKGLMGIVFTIYGSSAIVFITGFRDINVLQFLLLLLVTSIISLLIGFIQGLNNEDVMSALGSIKLLLLPMAASIAAIELLSDKWQKLFYWIPFYWSYKGNDSILSSTATWGQIALYSLFVFIISGVVVLFFANKIKEKLK